jgi:hypothetical protein
MDVATLQILAQDPDRADQVIDPVLLAHLT